MHGRQVGLILFSPDTVDTLGVLTVFSRQETPNSVCEVYKQKVQRSRRIGVQRGDGGDQVGDRGDGGGGGE